MTLRWWLATPRGRQVPEPAAHASLEAEAVAACRAGAVLVMETGAPGRGAPAAGVVAVALDPAQADDGDTALAAIAASAGPAERLTLRLPAADGWHDLPVESLDALLAQAALWIRLAQPPRWSTTRFALTAGGAVPLTGGNSRLPGWVERLVGRRVDGAAQLLALAGGPAEAVEALLAVPDDARGGPGLRYVDHHRGDDAPPALAAAPVRDWMVEAHAARHVVVARPAGPVTGRSQAILVVPGLRWVMPTLNSEYDSPPNLAIGAFMLNSIAGL